MTTNKINFKTESDGYKRCKFCDKQLKDAQYKFFYEHTWNSGHYICNDDVECLRAYMQETHSRQNLILPFKGNPFK